MGIKIRYNIKAILFGVDETVINTVNIGNSYVIEKDTMINYNLWREFDYTDFGLRRAYESAKLNDNLDVAVLHKNVDIDYNDAVFKPGYGWFIDEREISDIILDFEQKEIEYVDKKMRTIRLYSENGFNIKELLINTEVINQSNSEIIINYNSKIPFPDRIFGEIQKLNISNRNEIDKINYFIENTDLNFENTNFSSKILPSAAFLYDQSYTAPIITLKFMVCVIGLESLLIDGNSELSYRLSRNCAMLLSNNSDTYLDLFNRMKKIYKKRSDYVHNGIVKNLEEIDVIDVRDILRNVIFKILDKNITKDELMKELDLKGYIQ